MGQGKVNPQNLASEAAGGVPYWVEAGQRSLQRNSPVLNIHHNDLHIPPQVTCVRFVLPSSCQLIAKRCSVVDVSNSMSITNMLPCESNAVCRGSVSRIAMRIEFQKGYMCSILDEAKQVKVDKEVHQLPGAKPAAKARLLNAWTALTVSLTSTCACVVREYGSRPCQFF